MATITKRNDKFRVSVRKKGYPSVTKTFNSRANAVKWAKKVETEMEQQTYKHTVSLTLEEAVERYVKEADITDSGGLGRLRRLVSAFGNITLSNVTPLLVTRYKNRRLEEGMSPATVKKELGYLSRVFNAAIKDWHYELSSNPVSKIRKPVEPKGRSRRTTHEEEEKLLSALNGSIVRHVVVFALETGMRRSEMTNMQWQDINWKDHTLHIPVTKTGVPRTIPLTEKAVSVLKILPRNISGEVFGVHPHSITTAFKRACRKVGITNLHFHDLRHEATSRLFELGLNPMEVSAITGHQDLAMLKRYTHLKAEDLGAKLSKLKENI